MNSLLPWIVLLAPLVSAAVITLFTRRWKMLSSSISIAAVLASFICSCFIFAHRTHGAAELMWISISGVFQVPLGLTLDQLSRTMAVLVSGVGAVIHIYSLGYMRDDEGKARYFAALSLFMFAMLGIVLANNFVRSEEHTSELQSHSDLVCRLLLEKKKEIPRSAIAGAVALRLVGLLAVKDRRPLTQVAATLTWPDSRIH